MKEELTQEYLRERFDYDPEGFLIWKDHPKMSKHKRLIGTRTGQATSTRYKVCQLDGSTRLMHRLIFLWHHGYLPDIVDHDDRDPFNNKIENLLDRDQSANRQNSSYAPRNPDKASGYKNIQRSELKDGTYSYRVTVTRKGIRYGKSFRDIEKALEYRDNLLKELYGEGARA